MSYSFLCEGIFMSKKITVQSTEKNQDITQITQHVQQEYLPSKGDIFRYMRDMQTAPELSEQLDVKGVYITSLSMVSLPMIVYLMGLCDKKEFATYSVFEHRFIDKEKQEREEDLKNRYATLPDIEIDIRTPDYEDVLEYARGEGYVIPISKFAFEKALELKRTAGLLEVLKTNVNDFKLSVDDELHHSHWYDIFSQEETEYNILNELVLLQKSFPYTNIDLNSNLNLLICARWQKHLRDLKKIEKLLSDDIEASVRINFAIQTLKNLMPVKLKNISDEARKVLLYQTLQKAKEVVKNHPDELQRENIINWLNACSNKYEKSVPLSVKEAELIEAPRKINPLFFNHESEQIVEKVISTRDIEYENDQRIRKESDEYLKKMLDSAEAAKLSPEETLIKMMGMRHIQLFDTLNKHVKRKSEEDPEVYDMADDWFDGISKEHHGLVYAARLPDIYNYFILGIITKDQADEFRLVQKALFRENGMQKLHEIFDQYVEEQNGDLDEELETAYELYKTGNETGNYNGLNLNNTLLMLGVPYEELESFEPSVEETFTYLLKHDFERYLPLALRFKKEYFNLVDDFKEMAALLTENESGNKWLSIQNLMIKESCIDPEDCKKTRINRLTVLSDIYMVMDEYIGGSKSKDFIKAKILLQQMIFATYQDIFQSLDALPANEKYSDVSIQLKAMCRYFAGLYPKTDSLKNEEQNMAFLANVARSCLKTATKHPHIQDYYIKCFDMQFGSTAKEDEALSKRGVTRFPVTKKIPEVMKQSDFDDYNSLLLNKYFDLEERKINNEDFRCGFGVCSDVEILYAMGVLSNFEYERAVDAIEKNEWDREDFDKSLILKVNKQLEKDNPSFYLPITKKQMDVMRQIRLAGELVDAHYLYDNLVFDGNGDYKDKAPAACLYDYQKNPLRAEGKMLETLLSLMHTLPEENIQGSESLKAIVNSYWKESTQQLNDLVELERGRNPVLAEQISYQRGLFSLKKEDEKETVENRLKYYPKLFSLLRDGVNRCYIGGKQKSLRRIAFLEKEIAPFVQYYKKSMANPKLCSRQDSMERD